VQRLLRGDNFNFSSPVKTFFSDLKSTQLHSLAFKPSRSALCCAFRQTKLSTTTITDGFYHSEVVRYKAKVEKLQRRKYELDLMSYRGKQLQHVLAWKDAVGLVFICPSPSSSVTN
jgi:hypothetical protein